MKKKYWIIILAMCLILPACKKKQPYRIHKYYTYDEPQYVEENESQTEEHDAIDLNDYSNTSSADYSPAYLYVPQGTSLQEAFRSIAPQMDYAWQKPYVGGAKLIAEMSADAAGLNKSRFDQDYYIYILPLNQLKLRICDDSFNLYALACANTVNIDMCSIGSNGFFNNDFTVYFQLSNQTSHEVSVSIQQGQMIEAEHDNVQNVVIKDNTQVILQPYESKTVKASAACAAHHRSSPSGSKGRITPYILAAPHNAYNSQQAVWDYIEEPAVNRMVFYAWGRGPLDEEHESRAGHAFVFIPNVGYIGFGSAHGDWLDDEGVITNHQRQAKYAQDSCIVYITNTQLNNVYAKVNALKSNTPRYHVTYYDCTSFVMDIADAAGIYYGNRIFIQTPMYFMQELKKRN